MRALMSSFGILPRHDAWGDGPLAQAADPWRISLFCARIRPLTLLPMVLLVALLVSCSGGGLSTARWWLGEEAQPPVQEPPAPGQPASPAEGAPAKAGQQGAQPPAQPTPGAKPGEKPLNELGQRARKELELGHSVGPESGLYPWPVPEAPPEELRTPPVRPAHQVHGLAVGVRNAGHPHASDPLLSLRFHNTRGIVPEHKAGETLPRLAFAAPLALIVDSYLITRVTWPALKEPWPLFLGLGFFDSVELAWWRKTNSSTLPTLSALGAITEQSTQVNYGWLYAWPGLETLAFTGSLGRRGRTFFLPDSPSLRATTPRLMFKQFTAQIGVRWAPLPHLLLSLDDEVWGSAVTRVGTIPGTETEVATFEPFLRRPVFVTLSGLF
ncbi:MAG: hypothetical protein OEW39_05690 [Deltaproteobacteria bacterium]|nr:hypothetical protein [Deltaproteobacteria bacterium]